MCHAPRDLAQVRAQRAQGGAGKRLEVGGLGGLRMDSGTPTRGEAERPAVGSAVRALVGVPGV